MISPLPKNFEFIVKFFVFSMTFYYTLDYIFVCEVNNSIGISLLIITIITITILHSIYGRKTATVCTCMNK
jgi:hypothetical protein